MDKLLLGNTGLNVSKLCLGTLTMGPLQANLPLDKGAGIISLAIENGVNFFDTAELYETYGYLKAGMKLTGRDDIIISSKTYAYTKELAVTAVESARRELNRDYIDIFMLHEQESIHTLRGHMEALDYLFSCKAKGIVRAVGASMHHIAAVNGSVSLGLDCVHPMFNIAGLGIADGGIAEMSAALSSAYDSGLGIFTMKALGGGNLHHRAAECLDFVLSTPFIHSVAIGCQSEDELLANIGFFETGRFTERETVALKNKKRHLHIDEWCRKCGKCAERCPQSALTVGDLKTVTVDKDKCVLCGYCAAYCPDFCIKVV